MLKRWGIYLKESFNPVPFFTYAFLLTFALYCIIQIPEQGTATFTPFIFYPALLVLFFTLYVRTSDEFKDYETDKKYFPERAVPSGRVKLKDLTILRYCVVIILFLQNIFFLENILYFGITFLLFFLMGKWFFIKPFIANNRILAFITHMPVFFVLNCYLIIIYNHFFHTATFSLKDLYPALWCWIPLLTWEVARKTFAPGEEKAGYQTYSQLLGYKKAALLVILMVSGHVALLFPVYGTWKLTPGILAAFAVLAGLMIFICTRFLLQPAAGKNLLGPAGFFYKLLSYLLIIINSLFLQVG